MTATTVVTVTDIAISGLTAVNDSPTPLGNLTTLTATVSSGSDVNYIWDLGDSSQATGTVITHEYEQIGVYTAVVTATNTINTLTATAIVTVTEVAITGLTAVNSGPSELGTATFLTATTTAGTNISYTWDLGDGTVAYGSLISHTYSQTGTYTASVTATNSMSTVTATTVITISETVSVPTFPLYLPFVAKPVSPVALSPSTIQQQPQRGRLLP
jgi:PKD repeat protein